MSCRDARLSVVVLPSANRPAGTTEEHQDQTDHQQDDTYGEEDLQGGDQQTDDDQDDAEDDHLFSFIRGCCVDKTLLGSRDGLGGTDWISPLSSFLVRLHEAPKDIKKGRFAPN